MSQSSGPEPLGEKTAPVLLTMFQDFYRQDVFAEEDVHRTLPFFATALGLIIAAINYAAAQLPTLTELQAACPRWTHDASAAGLAGCAWPVLLAGGLLVLAALLGVLVLWFLSRATQRQDYKRVGPERDHIERTRALLAFHQGGGLAGEALDAAVALDLREQLLEDFATVIPINRELTAERYRLRAKAVSWLLWSLLSALVATIIILMTVKFGILVKAPPA